MCKFHVEAVAHAHRLLSNSCHLCRKHTWWFQHSGTARPPSSAFSHLGREGRRRGTKRRKGNKTRMRKGARKGNEGVKGRKRRCKEEEAKPERRKKEE